jgi:hypothetical protein
MKPNRLAGCLVVFVVGAELCESREMRFADDRTLSVEPRYASALAWNPHTHFELDTDDRATTVAPLVASGDQRSEERFRLFIYHTASGFRIEGYPVPAEIDGTSPQLIYGFRPSVEALTEVLSSQLGLPTSQIEDVQRTAVAGMIQEIGGSHSPATRLFRRSQLEQIGMTFRPID